MLKIIQDFIPKGHYNRPARITSKTYITIHETDNINRGAGARNHASYLKNPSTKVSYHFTVDEKETFQHLPLNEDAYHAGDGSGTGNRNSIGIELCVNSDGNFNKAVENLVLLVKKLMKEHNIVITNVVQHNKWSGKNCPRYLRNGSKGITWEQFISKVKQNENSNTEIIKAIDKLYEHKIINSPEYWKNNYMKLTSVESLIIKFANHLK